MKKILSYLKLNYKSLSFKIISVFSAFMIFIVPVSASEYGLNFNFYDGTGSGSTHDGGIFFYTYNYSGGKYTYYSNIKEFYGYDYRNIDVDNIYNTVAVFFHRPVDTTELQSVLDYKSQKFYIEFPIHVEFGNVNGLLNGNANCYLSSVDFLVTTEGNTESFSVDLNIDGDKRLPTLTSFWLDVGFTVIPSKPILDISNVSFNFSLPSQSQDYYVIARPRGPVIIKTEENIPISKPTAHESLNEFRLQEDALIYSQKDGLNSADEMFGSITDNVAGFPELLKGFNVVSNLINEAVNISPGLYIILLLSLVLGLFAFIVGMSHSLASTIDDSMSNESLDRSARRSYEVQRRVQNLKNENYERSKKE